MKEASLQLYQTGRYSPLRYPGGKGKIAKFVCEIIRVNGLSDGRYVEPYAGGAAIAWELLLTGVVRRVTINDISRPVFSFWNSVLNRTDELCRMIEERPVSIDEWDMWKEVFRDHQRADELQLAFAFFFLNRTNTSGILNGGIIGGRAQKSEWKIDARYNKSALIEKIKKISSLKSKIELTNMDAVRLLSERAESWTGKCLVYIDPPYFKKGRYLYHDAYRPEDHADISSAVASLSNVNWLVSYDDVRPIHDLYQHSRWLQYTLNYSARSAGRGREAMFFSEGLRVPAVPKPLIEIDKDIGFTIRPVDQREFAA